MTDYCKFTKKQIKTALELSGGLRSASAAAIHEIKIDHMESGQRTKIKLADKLRALTKLGEHLGIFSQTQKHDGVINVVIQNEEAGL